MPRPVVPMALAPRAASRALSSATCEGRISGQFGEMRRRANTSHAGCSISVCASRNSASSDSTTPLPMRQSTFWCRIPEGISDSTVFLPPMTSVWPALCPPWKRATARGALGEQVDDLALALVAPLGADDDDEFAHERSARMRR